ncbi:MAG: Nif3-like dinuclear metal center hexameric protein [Bacteroidales bacterium]|nr:Nif3-like dinuclear metal center hexameric protein [Bacteroidales bacterium]
MKYFLSVLIVTLLSGPCIGQDKGETLTAGDVVERMKANLTCSWADETVDTYKAGGPEDEVTGVACTFMATVDVLKKAVKSGCNLVITHEPTYYNHFDNKDLLEGDPVYEAKQAIIDENNMIVFRFHDHWHRTSPDGIYVGMIDRLQWDSYLVEGEKNIFDFPGYKLRDVTTHMKQLFPDAIIRVIGDPRLEVKRAAFSAGAPGSENHIRLLQQEEINLVVIGEAPEWESLSYVRDAFQAGLPKSMIILGHTVSEEAGMEYCARWMNSFIDEVPVQFIESGDPFHQ